MSGWLDEIEAAVKATADDSGYPAEWDNREGVVYAGDYAMEGEADIWFEITCAEYPERIAEAIVALHNNAEKMVGMLREARRIIDVHAWQTGSDQGTSWCAAREAWLAQFGPDVEER